MDKLTKKDFVLKAIENLRTEKSKGIHVVYSGFNAAFEKYYNEPSRKTTDELVAKGIIEGRAITGGFMIYKKGEMPIATNNKQVAKTLAKITG